MSKKCLCDFLPSLGAGVNFFPAVPSFHGVTRRLGSDCHTPQASLLLPVTTTQLPILITARKFALMFPIFPVFGCIWPVHSLEALAPVAGQLLTQAPDESECCGCSGPSAAAGRCSMVTGCMRLMGDRLMGGHRLEVPALHCSYRNLTADLSQVDNMHLCPICWPGGFYPPAPMQRVGKRLQNPQ